MSLSLLVVGQFRIGLTFVAFVHIFVVLRNFAEVAEKYVEAVKGSVVGFKFKDKRRLLNN